MNVQQKFKSDMEKAGFEVETYQGRFFYKGYAVRTIELSETMSKTKVKLQWDEMGRGFIVYPKQSMTSEEFAKVLM